MVDTRNRRAEKATDTRSYLGHLVEPSEETRVIIRKQCLMKVSSVHSQTETGTGCLEPCGYDIIEIP